MDRNEFEARRFPESAATADLVKYVWRKAGLSRYDNPQPEWKREQPEADGAVGRLVQEIAARPGRTDRYAQASRS